MWPSFGHVKYGKLVLIFTVQSLLYQLPLIDVPHLPNQSITKPSPRQVCNEFKNYPTLSNLDITREVFLENSKLLQKYTVCAPLYEDGISIYLNKAGYLENVTCFNLPICFSRKFAQISST